MLRAQISRILNYSIRVPKDPPNLCRFFSFVCESAGSALGTSPICSWHRNHKSTKVHRFRSGNHRSSFKCRGHGISHQRCCLRSALPRRKPQEHRGHPAIRALPRHKPQPRAQARPAPTVVPLARVRIQPVRPVQPAAARRLHRIRAQLPRVARIRLEQTKAARARPAQLELPATRVLSGVIRRIRARRVPTARVRPIAAPTTHIRPIKTAQPATIRWGRSQTPPEHRPE